MKYEMHLLVAGWIALPFALMACDMKPSQEQIDIAAHNQARIKEKCVKVAESLGVKADIIMDEGRVNCELDARIKDKEKVSAVYYMNEEEVRTVDRYLAIKAKIAEKANDKKD